MDSKQGEITVGRSTRDQLSLFSSWEGDHETSPYILPTTLDQHHSYFSRPEITYLTISRHEEPVGYFILAFEPGGESIEFRRIVMAEKGRGIAQKAIPLMELYCHETAQPGRIWLDVFDFNLRGIHVYEKLGYRRFDQRELDGKLLFFYEKLFNRSD
ncbi:MAG: GNAT family N-acetyltransferase [Pseudomonadota bacterium]